MGIVVYHKNIMWQQKELLERLIAWHDWKYKKYPICFPKFFPDAKSQKLWLSWTVEREVFHLPYGGSIYTLCWLAASLGQRWYPWFAVKSSQPWEVSSCGGGKSEEWKHSWELGEQAALVEDKNETFCRCQRGTIQGWCATLQVYSVEVSSC